MGSNSDTDTGARRRRTTTTATTGRTTVTVAAMIAVVGLAACAGGGEDDDATASTDAAAQAAPRADAASDEARTLSGADAGGASADVDLAATQVVGQQLAIEAHATMEALDVRAAVDRVSTTVLARGGQVTAADIDYARSAGDGEGDDSQPADARARLVVAVPPAELAAVRQALEEVGTLLSYDQLAEDVSERLTDLETQIANQRASLERIRELYANAADVDTIVRIEAELTNRETTLEQLLASQQALEDRVAMSTLTIDIATAPAALESADDGNDTGLGDALAGGWSAFAGGAFALVLALAAALPFVLTLLAVAVVALWTRQLVRRRHTEQPETVSSPPEPVSASRPE